jgi:hypothetical protein
VTILTTISVTILKKTKKKDVDALCKDLGEWYRDYHAQALKRVAKLERRAKVLMCVCCNTCVCVAKLERRAKLFLVFCLFPLATSLG